MSECRHVALGVQMCELSKDKCLSVDMWHKGSRVIIQKEYMSDYNHVELTFIVNNQKVYMSVCGHATYMFKCKHLERMNI